MTTPSQDYRIIQLTQGQVAVVDDADYEWLMQWKWYASSNRGQSFYAYRKTTYQGKQRCVLMHRVILGLQHGDKRLGDHINSSLTLDNRRSNLRITDNFGNMRNSKLRRNNKSGFKGVYFNKSIGKFVAVIRAGGDQIHLGSCSTAEDAGELYRNAAIKLHGEYARFQ